MKTDGDEQYRGGGARVEMSGDGEIMKMNSIEVEEYEWR